MSGFLVHHPVKCNGFNCQIQLLQKKNYTMCATHFESINQFIKQEDRSATYIDMHEIDIEIV